MPCGHSHPAQAIYVTKVKEDATSISCLIRMFDDSASGVVAVDEEIALQPDLRNSEAAGCNSVSWWNAWWKW